ncbi:MAG: hypothetical protein WCC04_00380 [Terriglobales bacterium]
MEGTAVKQAREKVVNAGASITERRPGTPSGASRAERSPETRAVGYGMPCVNCRAYYPVDMDACPICQTKERVSPTAGAQVATAGPATQPDAAKQLAEERDRLRELKSQIYASHPNMATAATFRCALDQNHDGGVEPAAVCHSCYSTARQQADRMEAALHIDVKDAARIVYEAVWADTSDPNKTYVNAANALLGELRKRAGIGANRPLAH